MRTMGERLLDVAQAAELLGVRERWIYEHPELPSFKIGRYLRFRGSELETWLEDQRRVQAEEGGDG